MTTPSSILLAIIQFPQHVLILSKCLLLWWAWQLVCMLHYMLHVALGFKTSFLQSGNASFLVLVFRDQSEAKKRVCRCTTVAFFVNCINREICVVSVWSFSYFFILNDRFHHTEQPIACSDLMLSDNIRLTSQLCVQLYTILTFVAIR